MVNNGLFQRDLFRILNSWDFYKIYSDSTNIYLFNFTTNYLDLCKKIIDQLEKHSILFKKLYDIKIDLDSKIKYIKEFSYIEEDTEKTILFFKYCNDIGNVYKNIIEINRQDNDPYRFFNLLDHMYPNLITSLLKKVLEIDKEIMEFQEKNFKVANSLHNYNYYTSSNLDSRISNQYLDILSHKQLKHYEYIDELSILQKKYLDKFNNLLNHGNKKLYDEERMFKFISLVRGDIKRRANLKLQNMVKKAYQHDCIKANKSIKNKYLL